MKRKAFHSSQEEREKIIEELTDLLRNRSEVVFAYVFGSFAEGMPFHDLDVGIYLTKIAREQVTEYGLALSQTLSNELKIPVDARILNFAPVLFLYHVIRGKLIFERDEEVRTRVVEQTIPRYLDLKPIILRGVKEAFGG
jgi:predicted nucleotidyltransferase